MRSKPDEEVDNEAMMNAIAGTETVVYGRDANRIGSYKTFQFAANAYSHAKSGSTREKLEDATLTLLLGEIVHGGSNLHLKVAYAAGELGFLKLSKSVISDLMDLEFPFSEGDIDTLAAQWLPKCMAFGLDE